MERNSDITVSEEVIEDLKRMKRIISSHVPNFTKVSIDVPDAIQKVIQQSAANQRILRKTASTHIKNTVQSGQYFGHALNSNHDMDIDMRRQRLSWLNREFPRSLGKNPNKKSFDSQTILQTIDKLRNMNGQQTKTQDNNREKRSFSYNPTSYSNEKDKGISSERISRELNRQKENYPHKYIPTQGQIQEEDIQDDSQGFVLLTRQYRETTQDESFEEVNSVKQEISNKQYQKITEIQSEKDSSNKESNQISNQHSDIISNRVNNNIYNQSRAINVNSLVFNNNNNNCMSNNNIPINYSILSRHKQLNQSEKDSNLPKIQKIKQEDKLNLKKRQLSYSPVKQQTMTFGAALQLDKNMMKFQEQLQQKFELQQLQNQNNQLSQNLPSQQSQRSRILSEDKRFESIEGSQMLPLSNSITSVNEQNNNQILFTKSLSNVQFSHLKQSRYIDYVNYINQNNTNQAIKTAEATNNPLKDSKLHSTSMAAPNSQQQDNQANLPLDDICKKNINNNRMVRKEIDLQKILNVRTIVNRSNQYMSQSGYTQDESDQSQGLWKTQDIVEFEKKLNCREKAQMNVYQHQFVKKYLTMKKEMVKMNSQNSLALSSNYANMNHQHSMNNLISNNTNSFNQGIQQAEQGNPHLNRLGKDLNLRQTEQQQQQQLYIGNNSGKIQYEQISSSDRFFSNSMSQDLNKLINSENNNHYIKEMKSFKLLRQIINRNPQQPNQSNFYIQQQQQQQQQQKQKLIEQSPQQYIQSEKINNQKLHQEQSSYF